MGYWQNEPDKLMYSGRSIFRGEIELTELPENDSIKDIQVVKAFIDDNNLVEMTVTSSCIGFVYTFTKVPAVPKIKEEL